MDLLAEASCRNGTTALLAEKGYAWAQTKDDVTVRGEASSRSLAFSFSLWLSLSLPCSFVSWRDQGIIEKAGNVEEWKSGASLLFSIDTGIQAPI